MITGAAYIRVSTDDQLEFSPAAQQFALQQYAASHQIHLPNQFVFIDEGISGRKAEKRPSFMNMISAAKCKPRPFDVILVHKFDRFARSREDSVVYKAMLRKECGISVISITEQLENDKFSMILESLLEAMAEYYSVNLSEEVKKGLFEKARRGEHIGKAPFGYRMENRQLLPEPNEFPIVQKIFYLYAQQQYSLSDLVRYLQLHRIKTKENRPWRTATLLYMLSNPVYMGDSRYNYKKNNVNTPNPPEDWIQAKGRHLPAISPKLFSKAQKRLSQKQTVHKIQTVRSFCQGLAFCSQCRKKLLLKSSGHHSYFSFYCSQCHCSWSSRTIEQLVLSAIKVDIGHFSSSLRFSNRFTNCRWRKDMLQRQFASLSEKKTLLQKAYLSGTDTLEEYQQSKQKLDRIAENLENELLSLQSDNGSNCFTFHHLCEFLWEPSIPVADKNRVLQQCIYQVSIDLHQKEIQLIYYAV